MEHLSKQQLVLLALLVSFVTSLSTGIFTVSLMSQAPQSVMQTINQVVEKTIEKAVVPNGAALVADSISIPERNASFAVSTVSKSLVKIVDIDSGNVLGLGLITNSKGFVVTDKTIIANSSRYNAIFPNGLSVPMKIALSQINGDIVFLSPIDNIRNADIKPIIYASSTSLGQSVYYLFGTTTPMLKQGIVTVGGNTNSIIALNDSSSAVQTSINAGKEFLGGPMFNINGEVIGINTSSMDHNSDGTSFYPVSNLKNIIQGL